MPPVLPTERIGTADCCIRPAGRNEMSAATPPIIFPKEVAQKQATPPPATSLTPQKWFHPNFQGWGPDENLKVKSPPSPGGGVHIGRGDKTKWGCFLHALDGMRGRAQVVTSRTITANARTTANLKANTNIGRHRVTALLELTEKPGALRRNPSSGTGRSCQKGSRCGLVPRCCGFWGANVYAKTPPKLPLESAMNSMPVHR
jgi:hypothetical protein